MTETKFKDTLESLLKTDSRLVDENKELNLTAIRDLADKLDEQLIQLLLNNKETKEKFFLKIKDVLVFRHTDFKYFLDENKIDNSYTAYENKIGLSSNSRLLKESGEVVLNFPYKDCVLEGGQTTEEGTDEFFEYNNEEEKYELYEATRKEIFFNEVLAQDEIDRLEEPKAFTNIKKYSAKKDDKFTAFARGKDGIITDNLLIKGNNLLALHSLKEEFSEQIKLIYIDPPYNTGNDSFKYNDKFNHSSWLAFMKNRLEIAKELLKEDGVIFISCDDNEQAYLKILLDEIFVRGNCESIIWRKTDPKYDKNTSAKIVHTTKRIHEYIHVGFKNKSTTKFGKIKKLPQWKTSKSNPDNDPRGGWESGIISFEEGHKNEDKNSEYYFTITAPSGRKITRHFFVKKDEFDKLMSDNRIYFPKQGDGVPRLKIFENEKKDFFFETILEGVGSLNSAKKEMATLFGIDEDSLPFNTLKPVQLILEIIRAVTNKEDIVLDFNAGSGTTAHSLLELNKEDDGNRQFILVEQMDYIETLTTKRIQKIINKNKTGSFVYLELAKWNEEAKEKIAVCKSLKELKILFKELCDKYFLHYNVRVKDFIEGDKEKKKSAIVDEEQFIKLPLKKQQEMFAKMLDLNQLYVNASEMEDKKFGLSKEDIALTKSFYNQK